MASCHGTKSELQCRSTIIDHLQNILVRQEHGLAFVFCNYKERAEQSHTNIVSSLLRQLVSGLSSIPEEVRSLYRRYVDKEARPSRLEIFDLLKSVVSEFHTVFIVVDALDECSDSDGTRSMLLKDLHRLLPEIRFLCTSRYLSDIERESKDCASLEIRATEADIRTYPQSRIEQEPRLKKHIEGDAALFESILETVAHTADGLLVFIGGFRFDRNPLIIYRFLLPQLHIGALARKHSRKAVRAALEGLPRELDTTYGETLQRIYEQPKDDVDLAETVLSWITFALAPLTVIELQHAIATTFLENGDEDISGDDLPDEDILLAVCLGFVIIDKESNSIRLVHFTTQEYLERNRSVKFFNAQEEIGLTCLKYLSLGAFHTGPCPDNVSLRDRLDRYPLVRYAAQNWGSHVRGAPEDSCQDAILRFLGNGTLTAGACQAEHIYMGPFYFDDFDERRQWAELYPRSVPETVIATKFGLTGIFARLRQKGHAHEVSDNLGMTPLIAAAKNGHVMMIEATLAAGVNINKTTRVGTTALMAAAENGHVDIMDILLINGAALEQKNASGFTALSYATRMGRTLAVEKLLDQGADINSPRDLLWDAARSGQPNLIGVLADRAKAAGDGGWIESALYEALAWSGGTFTGMKYLIDKGASLNFSRCGDTPIHLVARKGKSDVVSLLLAYKVDPNVQDDDGYTPLH